MRLIVNGIFVLEDFDTQRLGKYLRCIFQVILPLDDTLALQLLGETSHIAREGSQVSFFQIPTGGVTMTDLTDSYRLAPLYLQQILNGSLPRPSTTPLISSPAEKRIFVSVGHYEPSSWLAPWRTQDK